MRLFDLSDIGKAGLIEKGSHKGAFDSDSDDSEECKKIVGSRILTNAKALSRKLSNIHE